MPAPHPPEFRQRAIELARQKDRPIAKVAKVAKGLGISEPCLRNWQGVSTSGYYAWCSARSGSPSQRQQADEALGEQIRQIHQVSPGTYGSPRVYAELRPAAGTRCGRKRVARLMRADGLQGVYRRRRKGCTVRDSSPTAFRLFSTSTQAG